MKTSKNWYKILNSVHELEENKTKIVQIAKKTLAISLIEGNVGIIDNACPHMGGPLGEGKIVNGYLVCPWHGYEFHACTGKSPDGYDDEVKTYSVEIRDDGVYVEIEETREYEITVSDVMVETLVNWGINTVFGMIGHSNLGLADAMRRQEDNNKLQFIGIRHEGAASFAASAYAKLIGKPAACLTIAGPGATNLYTGMWDAKVDRAPLLVLTGQVATQVVGTGNFQEVDLVNAFSSVADFNHRVQRDSPHAELMSLAIKHAILNRDVSHLTFPDEVQVLPAGDSKVQNKERRMPNLSITPPLQEIEASIELIKKAKRPVIIVGHGAVDASLEILELAEKIQAPIMTTFKAKGFISDEHHLACGVLGKSGTPVSAHFMSKSDLLVVFGASFARHTGISESIPTIQVDFDPLALAKFHKISVRVLGEIKASALLFSEMLDDQKSNISFTKELELQWLHWKETKESRSNENLINIHPAKVFKELNIHAPKNAVMCVDVGNNAYSFGKYFECVNHRFLLSGYLGSIGFALPASIGAWAAVKNKRPIVAVAGDGGFAQYMAELTTIVKYKMPIKIIILNNNQLGRISKEQRESQFDVWKTELSNPKFNEFAESCGIKGFRAENTDQVEHYMKQLFEVDGPALLEILTDADKV